MEMIRAAAERLGLAAVFDWEPRESAIGACNVIMIIEVCVGGRSVV